MILREKCKANYKVVVARGRTKAEPLGGNSQLNSPIVIARSEATKQSIQLDCHALVPRARNDKQECEVCG